MTAMRLSISCREKFRCVTEKTKQLADFFMERPTAIVGIGYDNETIYLVLLRYDDKKITNTDKQLPTIAWIEEVPLKSDDENNDTGNIYFWRNVAQRIAVMFAKRGLAQAKTILCLNGGEVVADYADLSSVVEQEVFFAAYWQMVEIVPPDDHIKIVVHECGDGKYWIAAAKKSIIDAVRAAWRENGLGLAGVVAMPPADLLGDDYEERLRGADMGQRNALYAAFAACDEKISAQKFFVGHQCAKIPSCKSVSVFLFAVLLVLAATVTTCDYYSLNGEREQLDEVKARRGYLAEGERVMLQTKDMQLDIQRRERLLNKLKYGGMPLREILVSLGKGVAAGTYVSELAVKDDGGLTIGAMATDNERMANFVVAVEQNEALAKLCSMPPMLVEAKQDGDSVKFTLAGKVAKADNP